MAGVRAAMEMARGSAEHLSKLAEQILGKVPGADEWEPVRKFLQVSCFNKFLKDNTYSFQLNPQDHVPFMPFDYPEGFVKGNKLLYPFLVTLVTFRERVGKILHKSVSLTICLFSVEPTDLILVW